MLEQEDMSSYSKVIFSNQNSSAGSIGGHASAAASTQQMCRVGFSYKSKEN